MNVFRNVFTDVAALRRSIKVQKGGISHQLTIQENSVLDESTLANQKREHFEPKLESWEEKDK